MLILAAFFGQAIGTAAYPFLARLAAENKLEQMNDLLNRTLKYLALVIPFAALMIVLRTEIVSILFERGQFDVRATRQTAAALQYLMLGAGAFAVQTVVVRGYYAMQDTLFPAIYSTLAVVVSIPLYYAGMQIMGIRGVAMAMSFSATLQVLLLYIIWNRRTKNPQSRSVYLFYLQVIGISIALGIILHWVLQLLLSVVGGHSLWSNLSRVVLTGVVFTVLLTLMAHLLRIEPLQVGLQKLKQALFKKRTA
jgi:putative peptidoglycan lipid II flippase